MPDVYGMERVPPVTDYVRVLTALGDQVTAEHRAAFGTHYHAPDRTAGSEQIAMWAGFKDLIVVNSLYGKLGMKAYGVLGIAPPLGLSGKPRGWKAFCRGWYSPGGFVWQMLPEVAAALEQLGWVDPAPPFALPDEVSPRLPLVEGAVMQITVNAYERNSEARRQCIEAHGTTCCICQFSFGTAYGPEAEGYIHVHHLRPLSTTVGAHVVNPVEDLRPVCPNCHAVLHIGGRCRTIDEVRELMRRQRDA